MRRATVVGALAAAVLVVGAPGVSADHGAPSGSGSYHEQEAQLLGAEHAAEHEMARARERRALRRWRRLPRSERRRLRQRYRRRATAKAQASAAAAGPASSVGRWTVAPFNLPNYAIHSALLPTGKVLFWSYPPLNPDGRRPNVGNAALWDPEKGTGPESMAEVPPPVIDLDGDPATPPAPAPLFCSGQSHLPTGELLVTGGNLVAPNDSPNDAYTKYAGHKRVFTFDPWTERWTEQPQMATGRWYPTQTLLADGRTVIVSGYNEQPPGGVLTNLVEEYTPAGSIGGQGSTALLSGAQRSTNLYPRLHLMPDGDVLMTGAGRYHVAKLHTLTPGSGSWTGLGSVAPMTEHHGAGTVVQRSGEPDGSYLLTSIGGYPVQPAADGNYYGTTTAETLDYRNPAAGWSPEPPLQVPRAHHNTVLLPDGSMATVGGGVGITPKQDGLWAVDPGGPQRQVELFDPATETWRLGPAQVEDRSYHSTAMLLPDGRVWSAGDDVNPKLGGAPSSFDTAEIYTPPPLYNGERPRIDGNPSQLRWGDEFTVHADADAATPVKAVLMAPAAVTHGVDMGQRRVELEVTQPYDAATSTIKLTAPPTAQVAPPGYYMLFLLSENGVYSSAAWTRLTDVPGNQAPVAVASADPTSGPSPLTVDFDGTGSSDPEGDPLTYAWDLDEDGQYDDSTSPTPTPTYTYTQSGGYAVGLEVTDDQGATGTATVAISVDNAPPAATITSPAADQTWRVGQQIDFVGSATDQEDGILPASALDWSLVLQHCPSNCHEHSVQSFPGTASGSFPAPDHGYPSYLELGLTATDSGGLQDTRTVRLDPRTVDVTMALAQPWFGPLSLTLNSETATAPFTRPVIEGSSNTISAPTPQVGAKGFTYDFTRWWYLGSTQTRTVTVNAATTYTAAYVKR